MKPKWKHDCTACAYLGSMHMHNHTSDWYVCSDSVIARRSDDGPDYWSMPIDMVTDDRHLTASRDDVVAYYNMVVLARFMLNRHKKEQKNLDLREALALAQLAAKLDGFKETT